MRNVEYSLNRGNGRRELEESIDCCELEKYLLSLELPDYIITNVLKASPYERPKILRILERASYMTKSNPQLSWEMAVRDCISMGQEPEDADETTDGYANSLLFGIKTWEDFVPVNLRPEEIQPVLFSELPRKDGEEVDCQVFGRHRDRASSSKHFYEHVISHEKE